MSGTRPSASRGESPRSPGTRAARRFTRGLAGFLVGAVDGVVITLCLVVLRAAIDNVHLHGLGDLLGWISAPALLLPVGGLWAAIWPRFQHFWSALAGNTLGLAAGAAAGALVGSLLTDLPSGPWTGGILGAGAGIIVGTVTGVLRGADDPSQARGPGAGALAALAAGMILTLLLGGSISTESPPEPPSDSPGEPAPSDVESLIVFVGDPGGPPDFRYPVLERAEAVVDRWSSSLARDSSVAVLVLGDIVYPRGLRSRDDSTAWERDSLVIASQIEMVSGGRAAGAGGRLIFLPGNHDWGHEEDWEGAVRLHRLEEFLTRWEKARDVSLHLAPPPGTGGPEVVDLGSHLRLVILDTAWWLLEGDPALKEEVLEGVEEAFRTADGREVVVAAHHPFASGGPHGELPDFRRTMGLGFLLTRAGMLLQDLTSEPYVDLRQRLVDLFASLRPPALFVGGHEHSVQLFRGIERGHPEMSLAVGSASKLTGVDAAPGMELGLAAPGLAKLFVLEDGSLELFIETADPDYLRCPHPTEDDPEAALCMSRALASFATVWGGKVDAALSRDRPRAREAPLHE